MPTIPTVFRSIRKNDVHHKPFKAYKNYSVTNSSYSASGYRLQKAYHVGTPPTIGDGTTDYVTDSNFNSVNNMHVMWNSLDHKYYRHPYDPANCLELTNIDKVEKFLFYSASTLVMPYLEVGERIKPESVIIDSTVQNFQGMTEYTMSLYDDKYGNLKDTAIDSSSFAKKDNLQFYLTFNNLYKNFDFNLGKIPTGSIEYLLNKMPNESTSRNIEIRNGVSTHFGGSNYFSSGLSAFFTSSDASYIKIDHDNYFEQFNKCDHWAISFWIKPSVTTQQGSIITKGKIKKERYYDGNDDLIKERDIRVKMPIPGTGNFTKHRTPFQIGLYNEEIHFHSSDGSRQLHISASAQYRDEWMNVIIHNSESLCRIAINGTNSGTSGSIPRLNTSNTGYVFIGAHGDKRNESFQGEIAEVRMYDYALPQSAISSLANQNFISGSLYQTSTPGNVFYKNGQIVVSSPLQKYNNLFISSSNESAGIFTVKYKGTHTIYENEVMVRVPKGACNISVNPSAVYRPASGLDNNCNEDGKGAEQFNRPGDFRKSMFLSGSAFPYITTIGLYNDKAQLLAVGKLAEPVQKRNDIDMNFIVRWDY